MRESVRNASRCAIIEIAIFGLRHGDAVGGHETVAKLIAYHTNLDCGAITLGKCERLSWLGWYSIHATESQD